MKVLFRRFSDWAGAYDIHFVLFGPQEWFSSWLGLHCFYGFTLPKQLQPQKNFPGIRKH